MNALQKLIDYGQSYWLDNLSREKILNGELKQRVTEQGLRGVTSNPSIFNEAISGSNLYNAQIKTLVKKGASPEEIYDSLTIKDVQDACDILLPVFKESNGTDGFVSLEVSPDFARNTEGSMQEALRLYKAVSRKNCMIKIPGTREGLPAIEEMLYEGVNINITLLFSIERYESVAHAYIRALQRRVKEKKPVEHIISVASFFLSRIDTLTDKIASQYIEKDGAAQLLGKAGTASAVMAYQRFKEIFSSDEWRKLEKKGGHIQRVLWASTSNKDILYDDLRYVEPLIGSETINTLPEKTIEEFAKNGKLNLNSIELGIEDAKHFFSLARRCKIDMDMITQQLENEGVQKFSEAYQKLMSDLALKRIEYLNGSATAIKINSSLLEKEWKALCESLDEIHASERLFAKDATLWKDSKQDMETIIQGLGWLQLPEIMLPRAENLIAFANQIKKRNTHPWYCSEWAAAAFVQKWREKHSARQKDSPNYLFLITLNRQQLEILRKAFNLKKHFLLLQVNRVQPWKQIAFFIISMKKQKKYWAKKQEGILLLSPTKEQASRA